MPRKEIRQAFLTGERALFAGRDLAIFDTTFADGESPLKESADISLSGCLFKWKYPLWYSKNIEAHDCVLFETARAGVWYTENALFADCMIEAPKTFRRSRGIRLVNVSMPHASETLWQCERVLLRNVQATGDYFGMNSSDVEADGFSLAGNYAFDGAKRLVIRNAKLLTKDAFWNCEDVTVQNSLIAGEYLGWNTKRLTLENCTIESLQGMCYIDELVLRNCKLLNTTLAFEYSTVDAEIVGKVDSVLNPTSGTIRADEIGELILERDKIDPGKTKIFVKEAV